MFLLMYRCPKTDMSFEFGKAVNDEALQMLDPAGHVGRGLRCPFCQSDHPFDLKDHFLVTVQRG